MMWRMLAAGFAGCLLAGAAWAIDPPAPPRVAATGRESVFLPNETFRITGEGAAYKLWRPNQTQFQQAGGTNLGVPSGTVVATEHRTATMILNEAVDVIVHPDTEVSVNYFSRGITLGLVKGKVDCLVNRERWRGKYVNVVHNNLVSSAVGTHFVYEVQGHNVVVDVYEGSVIMHVTHAGWSANNPDGLAPGTRLATPIRVVFNRDGSAQAAADGTWDEANWQVDPQDGLRFDGRGITATTGRGHYFQQTRGAELERMRREGLPDDEALDTHVPDPQATCWRRATRGHPVSEEQRARLEAARERCAWEMRLVLDSVVRSGATNNAANSYEIEGQRNRALMDYFAIIAEVCGVNPPPRGRQFHAEDYDCERIRREIIPVIRSVVAISSQEKNSDGMREALESRDIPQLGAKNLLVFLENAVADNQISADERRHLQDVLDWMAVLVDAPDTPVPNP